MADDLAQRLAALEARMDNTDARIEQSRQERSEQYKDISSKLYTRCHEVTHAVCGSFHSPSGRIDRDALDQCGGSRER